MRLAIDKSDPAPLYIQVKERLKEYITLNELKEGSALPDIKTISRNAGVSLETVEKGVCALIEEGVCYRRPKKGTFVGALRRQEMKSVCAVYYPEDFGAIDENVIHAALHRGIITAADAADIDVLMLKSDAERKISFYRAQSGISFEGLILPHSATVAELSGMAEKFPDIKIFQLNYEPENFEETPDNVFGVFNDDFAGGCLAGEWLAGRGHRKIAVFSLDIEERTYRDRVDGLKQALGDNGVKLEAENMILFKKSGAEDNRDLGRRLAADFFSGGAKDISAVFSPNDLIAAGVSDYLREAGINGVELCGYDNALPWISKDCGFSTVAVDYEKIGARAVSPMSKPSARAPKIVRVPPKLIPRDQPAQ